MAGKRPGLGGAKQNISKHYDISMKLYEQMLGPTMQCLVDKLATKCINGPQKKNKEHLMT